MKKGALLSEGKAYRYSLWRIWDESKPKVLFIMHNPSTADEDNDDPTIRRCIQFAKDWGYGGIYVGNLSPYRATNPKELKGLDSHDLYPRSNTLQINRMETLTSITVLAYGVTKLKLPVFIFPQRLRMLKLTKGGQPCHPLYLKSDLKPQELI